VVLLRPAADGPELTGEYERAVPGWGRNLWFRYKVIRVWELPPDRLLAAGLPVLPLAPVSRVPEERLPEVLIAVAERLRNEAGLEWKATLWAATEILLGLYHPSERVQELTREITAMILGIRGIEESSVYQDIFAKGEAKGRAEGELEEARKILLGLGRKKLGQPDERVLALVGGISDRDRLNLLLDRILDVASWDELLATTDS
jgi:predicted transposase YdaD